MPICNHCKIWGHIQRHCPNVQCYRCKGFGHFRRECPQRHPNRRSVHVSSPSSHHDRRGSDVRCTPSSQDRKGTKGKGPACPATIPKRAQAKIVDLGRERYYGCVPRQMSPGKGSPEPREPALPVQQTARDDDIRSDEAVTRVLHALRLFLLPSEGPWFILPNVDFSHFRRPDAQRQQLRMSIPEEETELHKGDFDIVGACWACGYFHLEVKAFGGCLGGLGERDIQKLLRKNLAEKCLGRLSKCRRALGHLQPRGDVISVISSLAYPNVHRSLLRSVLNPDSDLRQRVADLLCPSAGDGDAVAVEELCLCADDLPSKDGIIDVADETVRNAMKTWFQKLYLVNKPATMADTTFADISPSFLRVGNVRRFFDAVCHTGDQYGQLVLNDLQRDVIKSEDPYAFVTGPPGCGKSVVLAEKAAQWLKLGETVFLVYKAEKFTSLPATETVLTHLSKILGDGVPLDKLHKQGLSRATSIKGFIENMVEAARRPSLGKAPWRLEDREENEDDIEKADGADLKSFFTKEAMLERRTEPRETGRGMNVILDELTHRTIEGRRARLIAAILERLPEARVWTAGPLPSHCPEGFSRHKLLHSYRCPPRLQALLKALEGFCHSEDGPIFEYALTCTGVPRRPEDRQSERAYRLPDLGTHPWFLSHVNHRAHEIIDCDACAALLVDKLKTELKISKGPGDSGISESDVLIVTTGFYSHNQMKSLSFTPFCRKLTAKGFRVNVFVYRSHGIDCFDSDKPGMTMIPTKNVAGIERKVVVFLPSRFYENSERWTYADVVRQRSTRAKRADEPHPRNHRSDELFAGTMRGVGNNVVLDRPSEQDRLAGGTTHGGNNVALKRPSEQDRLAGGTTHGGNNVVLNWPSEQDRLAGGTTHVGNNVALNRPSEQDRLAGGTTHVGNNVALNRPSEQDRLAGGTTHSGNNVVLNRPSEQDRLAGGTTHGGNNVVLNRPSEQDRLAGGTTHGGNNVVLGRPNEQDRLAGGTTHGGNNVVLGRLSQQDIRKRLEDSCCLTKEQVTKLATLGGLNLHWLWYSASRALAHLIIFHF